MADFSYVIENLKVAFDIAKKTDEWTQQGEFPKEKAIEFAKTIKEIFQELPTPAD
jgi:hypothetical protein